MAKNVNLTGEEVVELTAQYMSESDVQMVQKALDYATKAHFYQVRQSGEPYIIHPIQVAGILAELHLDAVTVACGFLHDVVEDTELTLEDIEKEFSTFSFIYDVLFIHLVLISIKFIGSS